MSVSISHERALTLIRSSFEKAPEVWAGPLDAMKQITHLNDGMKPAWGRTENIEWTNDGFKVQGWLLYPANYDPAKKYPLLVSVHGGPSSAVTPRWPGVGYGGVPFSALGYFVFIAESARQLWAGREVYPGQHQGLRLRRPERHSGWDGRAGEALPYRQGPRGTDGLGAMADS